MPQEPHPERLSGDFRSGILSVSELNRDVRDLLEHRYPLLWVRGEISNLVLARSGHAYFSLKDEAAQVRCVMFRHRIQHLDGELRDGLKVEVQALVSLYEPRGDFQLNIETLRRAGMGALFEAFLRLRDRLQAEGLFDEDRKRALPFLPRSVGVITSLDAAALRDILITLRRRNPAIGLVVYPTPVQGEGAAAKIAAAIELAGRRADCEVLILARGGGSLEDLWAYNDERVARAIRACALPVVTGIGHESDLTIADLAADRRASTPTGAAEQVSPTRAELLERIRRAHDAVRRRAGRDIETRMQLLDHLQRRLVHPGQRVHAQLQSLDHLRRRLSQAARHLLEHRSWQLAREIQGLRGAAPRLGEAAREVQALLTRVLAASGVSIERARSRHARLAGSLAHLDPGAVLERGYSIVSRAGGEIVRDSAALKRGEMLSLRFARGGATARVNSKT